MSDIHAQSIPLPNLKTSGFDWSHSFGASTNIGIITPIFSKIIPPHVKWSDWSEFNLKFSPLNVPIMQRMEARVDWFAVPLRLLHKEWEDFATGGKKGTYEGTPPYITASSGMFVKNGIFDYLRVQPHTVPAGKSGSKFNTYKFQAYQKIYADYYADEVLDNTEVEYIEDNLQWSGGNQNARFTNPNSPWAAMSGLKTICYKKDYFTSAQPEPQKGDSVYLMAPLRVEPYILDPDFVAFDGSGLNVTTNGDVFTLGDYHNSEDGDYTEDTSVRIPLTMHDIEEYRAIQNFNDNNALYGGRYVEQLRGRWRVNPDDARMQRAEFIGGGKFILNVTEVTQTSKTDTESGDYLGGYAGKLTGLSNTSQVRYFTREDVVIMGLLSIRPDTKYSSGTERDNLYMSRWDFLIPEFDNIGEQVVKNGQLFLTGDHVVDDAEFGYQPIYDDYRSINSAVVGDFRDDLDFWHTALKFESTPSLNSEFVHVDHNDFDRIFADADEKDMHVFFECFHHMGAILPLRRFPVHTRV